LLTSLKIKKPRITVALSAKHRPRQNKKTEYNRFYKAQKTTFIPQKAVKHFMKTFAPFSLLHYRGFLFSYFLLQITILKGNIKEILIKQHFFCKFFNKFWT